MCTSASADQRSEALGARNAGECRLAQDGLEHDEAGAGVDERQEEQGDEEESGKRAADHFEEPGPLVVERVLRRDICNIVRERDILAKFFALGPGGVVAWTRPLQTRRAAPRT